MKQGGAFFLTAWSLSEEFEFHVAILCTVNVNTNLHVSLLTLGFLVTFEIRYIGKG